MVVTDDQGRYVLPDLPEAKYKVWVRGYGLVDSAKVDSEPGKALNLTANKATTDAAAAEYYPAIYWYSMIKVPEKAEFPAPAERMASTRHEKSRASSSISLKTNGCVTCHQLGNKATRDDPQGARQVQEWPRGLDAPDPVRPGMTNMVNTIERMGTQATLKMFGEWTDRIAEGELPATKPQRPQGRRAQRRRHGVGLVEPEGLPARRDRERQAQSDR